MSSTMSTFRMPNHTLSPSTSPTRPTRMSTTPKICANRLSIMSGDPPTYLLVCCQEVYDWARPADQKNSLGIVRSLAQKTNHPLFAPSKRRGLVSEEASCQQSGDDQHPLDPPATYVNAAVPSHSGGGP